MANDWRTSQVPGMPRGIRNNNPGNIKPTDKWQGAVGDDGTFIIFSDMSWGTRAVGQSIIHMIGKGYNTINKLIRQWSATDQDAYVTNVSGDTGIGPDDPLGADSATIAALIRAISNQENGDNWSYDYVTDEDIQEGISKINSGLVTSLQAVVVDATVNPWPYTIGAIVIIGLTWFFSQSRPRATS